TPSRRTNAASAGNKRNAGAEGVSHGGGDLGGGPSSHMDEGAGNAKDRRPRSTHDLLGARGGNEDGSLNNDPSHSHDVEGEAGEAGASRGHDLLGPNLGRSSVVKALTDAYSKRRR